MASRRTTRFAAAISVAALALSLTGGAVFAGEVNGAGTKDDFSQGRSVCKFSGLNDDPTEAFPFGGRVQSYGYSAVRNGLKAYAPSPGVACNPNGGFEE
jgi:hypothetical protein